MGENREDPNYKKVYQDGYQKGIQDGYKKGYQDGYRDGYKKGIRDGIMITGGLVCCALFTSGLILKNYVGQQFESFFYSNKTDLSTRQRFLNLEKDLNISTEFVNLNNGSAISYLYKPKADPVLPDENRVVIIVGGLPGIDPHWTELIKNINNRASILIVHPAGYEPSTGQKNNRSVQSSIAEAIPKILNIKSLNKKHLVIIGESAGANALNQLLKVYGFDLVYLIKPMISPGLSLQFVTKDANSKLLSDIYNFAVVDNGPLLNDPTGLQSRHFIVSIGSKDALVNPDDQIAMVKRLQSQPEIKVKVIIDPKANHYDFDPQQVTNFILNEK